MFRMRLGNSNKKKEQTRCTDRGALHQVRPEWELLLRSWDGDWEPGFTPPRAGNWSPEGPGESAVKPTIQKVGLFCFVLERAQRGCGMAKKGWQSLVMGREVWARF